MFDRINLALLTCKGEISGPQIRMANSPCILRQKTFLNTQKFEYIIVTTQQNPFLKHLLIGVHSIAEILKSTWVDDLVFVPEFFFGGVTSQDSWQPVGANGQTSQMIVSFKL